MVLSLGLSSIEEGIWGGRTNPSYMNMKLSVWDKKLDGQIEATETDAGGTGTNNGNGPIGHGSDAEVAKSTNVEPVQGDEGYGKEGGEGREEEGKSDEAGIGNLSGYSAEELQFTVEDRYRVQCLRDVQERINKDYSPYIKGRKRIALVDVALHENLGDVVLWRSPIRLAANFGLSIDLICSLSQGSWQRAASGFPRCTVERVVNSVAGGGLVLFHGGGNWGDLYRFVQAKRLPFLSKLAVASREHNFTALSLPQSIFYKPGSRNLYADDDIMNKLPQGFFSLFLRQQDSYGIAKRHYKSIGIHLSPDIAFALGPLQPVGKAEYDVLFLIRQDGETQKADKGVWKTVEKEMKSANLTFRIQDWWYHPKPGEFSKQNIALFSEVRTQAAIRAVSQGKIVVTNRLHASILSTLVGKRLIWVDTVTQKVSKTRSVAFNTSENCMERNLHATQASTMKEAIALAIAQRQQVPFVY